MAEAVSIRNGSFCAQLYPERLGDLPRTQLRKLLRLMRNAPEVNLADMARLSRYVREQVDATQTAWRAASADYILHWKLVPNPKSRTKKDTAILRENRRLRTTLKRAKAAHDTAVILQTILNEECIDDADYHE